MKVRKVYQGLCTVLFLYGMHIYAMDNQAVKHYEHHLYRFKTVIDIKRMQKTLIDRFVQSPEYVQNFAATCTLCNQYVQALRKAEKINLPLSVYAVTKKDVVSDDDSWMHFEDFYVDSFGESDHGNVQNLGFYFDDLTINEKQEIATYGLDGWQERVLAKNRPTLNLAKSMPTLADRFNIQSDPPAFKKSPYYVPPIITKPAKPPFSQQHDYILVNELVKLLHADGRKIERLYAAAESDKEIKHLVQSSLIDPDYENEYSDLSRESDIIDGYRGLYNKIIDFCVSWDAKKEMEPS
jgi:hypothetical protein